ncbi:MAG: hypothetical protein KAR13_08050, partial [Desulfobulbaceae bacterium]|nr:hypothetical protein [Desulfobulbaceae bacterium]
GASQGGKRADQQISADFDTFGMLGSLIAFLWSAAEYLRHLSFFLFFISPLGVFESIEDGKENCRMAKDALHYDEGHRKAVREKRTHGLMREH